jgi:hypothetical protein
MSSWEELGPNLQDHVNIIILVLLRRHLAQFNTQSKSAHHSFEAIEILEAYKKNPDCFHGIGFLMDKVVSLLRRHKRLAIFHQLTSTPNERQTTSAQFAPQPVFGARAPNSFFVFSAAGAGSPKTSAKLLFSHTL